MKSKRIILTVLLLAVPHAHGMLTSLSTSAVGQHSQSASYSILSRLGQFFNRKKTIKEPVVPQAANKATIYVPTEKSKTPAATALRGGVTCVAQPASSSLSTLIQNYAHDPEYSRILRNMEDHEKQLIKEFIAAEIKNPGYRSFFHGTSGNLAVLWDLQKKLYAQYENNGKEPTNFEFFRARTGRNHLRGITKQKYIESHEIKTFNFTINDSVEPYRTDLLSVAYTPFVQPFSLYLQNCSFFPLQTRPWVEQILGAYQLPTPAYEFPQIRRSILLHIMLAKPLLNRLVYDSSAGGGPRFFDGRGPRFVAHVELLETFEIDDEARIILAPDVFDRPNDDVKIYRYQQRDQDEKLRIDAFCDKLITDAQKLKANKK